MCRRCGAVISDIARPFISIGPRRHVDMTRWSFFQHRTMAMTITRRENRKTTIAGTSALGYTPYTSHRH